MEHQELFWSNIIKIDGDKLPKRLCDIYTEMAPNYFGRIIMYLNLQSWTKLLGHCRT